MFVADRLEAIKWRNWKVVFYDEQRNWWTVPAKLGNPKAFDLITDPKEEYPQTGLQNSWIAGPAMKVVVEFEQSLRRYPLIAPGTLDPYRPPSRRFRNEMKSRVTSGSIPLELLAIACTARLQESRGFCR